MKKWLTFCLVVVLLGVFLVACKSDNPFIWIEELPLVDDAKNVSLEGNILTYETSSSPLQLFRFYQQSLPPRGWDNSLASFTNDSDLSFEHEDGRQLLIKIEPSADARSMIVTLNGTNNESSAE